MAEPSHVGRHLESNPFTGSARTSAEDNLDYARSDELTRKQAWCLYLSHTLSMWNSRMYEFAAVRTFSPEYGYFGPGARKLTNNSDFVHPSSLPRNSSSFVNQVIIPPNIAISNFCSSLQWYRRNHLRPLVFLRSWTLGRSRPLPPPHPSPDH